MHPQLTLLLDSSSAKSFDSLYVSEANSVAVAAVKAMATQQSSDTQIYIHGPLASGKSHLAMAACSVASSAGFRAAYIPGELVKQREALAGLEQYDLVCADQFESITSESEDAWFHCINRARESNTRLMFFSTYAPKALPLQLNDLRTRLEWGAVFQLSSLQDIELEPALIQLFTARGMIASGEVVQYILKRHRREISALVTLIDAIDTATLTLGRALTIPVVRDVLNRLEC